MLKIPILTIINTAIVDDRLISKQFTFVLKEFLSLNTVTIILLTNDGEARK